MLSKNIMVCSDIAYIFRHLTFLVFCFQYTVSFLTHKCLLCHRCLSYFVRVYVLKSLFIQYAMIELVCVWHHLKVTHCMTTWASSA